MEVFIYYGADTASEFGTIQKNSGQLATLDAVVIPETRRWLPYVSASKVLLTTCFIPPWPWTLTWPQISCVHLCPIMHHCCKFGQNLSSIFLVTVLASSNKKAVLSQRWPRNAPYTWVSWKFSGLPYYAHGYYSQHFSRAFVRINPLNVPAKYEVRSFIRSSDNRGYPKNLESPWIRPCSLFSKIFNRLS